MGQRFGTFSFIVDGRTFSPRGSWTISPTNRELDAEMNLDGTMFNTEKPVPAMAEGSISGYDDVDALMGLCDATVHFSFDDGDTFVFSGASIVGRPAFNMETGETTGVVVKSPRARKI